MLFWAHAVAAGGNAMKVAVAHGNPLAINAAQWGALFKRLVRWWAFKQRDRTAELIVTNRSRIQAMWSEIDAIELDSET